MTSGKFHLKVRRDGETEFRHLETASHDELAPKKAARRDGVLDELRSRAAGWQSNYAPYANAAFQIIDEPSDYRTKPFVVDGPK